MTEFLPSSIPIYTVLFIETLVSIPFLGSWLLLTLVTDHSITVNPIQHLHMLFALHFHLF